jgi:GNAT superfamily N-acetyltransferase
VYRTEPDTWDLFKKHHYMTQEMNMGASCYVFVWENMIVGFCGTLANPGKGLDNAWRISRLVVLPDFQGLGIGSKIAEFISSLYASVNNKMYIKTVNPSLGNYFERSSNWQPTSFNGKVRGISETDKLRYANRLTRASYCYKYVGNPIYGFEDLLKPIEKLRYEKSMEGQLCLF